MFRRFWKATKFLYYKSIVTILGLLCMIGVALADDTGLRIEDNSGKGFTKERIFSLILTGAWKEGKPIACENLKKALSVPGDYSAYDIECNLGNVVDVKAIEQNADGFILKVTLDRSRVKANFTQPHVGKWGDPSVDISWESFLNVKVKYADTECSGWPGKLPWLVFESATFEMMSPTVDVDSTVADVVGGITGFFSGFLFSGTGSIPLAIAGAFGTSAVIDGIAKGYIPGEVNFADGANNELMKNISPCELVKQFGGLVGKFQTRSLTSNLVTVSATSAMNLNDDFNNDSRGDILWHNAATNETQIWHMNGFKLSGRATVLGEDGSPAFVGLPFRIVGAGDYNDDRKADVLWYNNSTGETQIWYMDAYKISGRATVLGEDGNPVLIGPPFSIVATNDFNQDQKADILWHNASTGETQIWHMDGNSLKSRSTVLGEDGNPAFVGLPWSIVGSNDFNQDQQADILWHNASTGETQIWHMNDYRLSGRATVLGENGNPVFIGPPFSIVGTNDFNQDRSADIFWHNASTGETQIWHMNGYKLSSRATVLGEDGSSPAFVGEPWSIVSK